MTGPLRAVVFDLDDTLFPQRSWLEGAWQAVAALAFESHGVPVTSLVQALSDISEEGTARGGIIDRALLAVGRGDVDVGPLVERFRAHRPARLEPYPGAVGLLTVLGRVTRLGLVTDGDPAIQRGKLEAIGIAGHFDAIVCSDDLGRECRKPHSAPFLAVSELLGVDPAETAYVGDNPEKDVVGARSVGMMSVRVRTGEYAACEIAEIADLEAEDLDHVGRQLLRHCSVPF